MLISEIPEVLTVYNFVYSGCPFGCSNHPHLLEKVGERGRNRTFNLLIKSQLLCQLSYAPTANRMVGTNFDYSIRSACFRRVPICSFCSLLHFFFSLSYAFFRSNSMSWSAEAEISSADVV